MTDEQILFKYCEENNIPFKYAINYKDTLGFSFYLLRFRFDDFFNSLFIPVENYFSRILKKK